MFVKGWHRILIISHSQSMFGFHNGHVLYGCTWGIKSNYLACLCDISLGIWQHWRRHLVSLQRASALFAIAIAIFIEVTNQWFHYGPLAVKLRVAHAFSPPPRVSDPDMHHDTCMTHVHAWIANERFALNSVVGKTFPIFPVYAQSAILRIRQEAHVLI